MSRCFNIFGIVGAVVYQILACYFTAHEYYLRASMQTYLFVIPAPQILRNSDRTPWIPSDDGFSENTDGNGVPEAVSRFFPG